MATGIRRHPALLPTVEARYRPITPAASDFVVLVLRQ